MPVIRQLLWTALLLLAAALPATAQYGPGQLPNPPGGGDNPAPAGQGMAVPDYIKPGFQMLYTTASSTEADAQGKGGGAGMGFTEYTIVAVDKDKVLVTVANYLTPQGMPLTAQGAYDPSTDPKAQLVGASSYAISKLDVQGGNAMWMPVKELANWQSGNGVEVQRGPWVYQDKQVNSATITVKGNDSISSNTYHADNGMKLTSRNGFGPLRRGENGTNPYNRKNQSQMQLITTRQIDLPMLGAKWPDWTKKVKKMNYTGTYSMAVPGVQAPPVQLASSVEFTERGEDYIIGKSTIQTQGGQPTTSAVVQGPGSILGYWVHPDVLAKLEQGTIDQNELMRTTLTYQVQDGNLGQLGVFVLTNKTQSFYAVSGYNLQSGALTYMSLHTAETGVTIEFGLSEIESD